MATFDDLFKPAGSAMDFVLFPARSYDMDGPALILHSSGECLVVEWALNVGRLNSP